MINQSHHIFLMLPLPTRRSTHDLHAFLESAHIVVVSCRRRCKFDGNVRRAESLRTEIFSIIYIYGANDLVTSAERDLFNHPPHFTIAY